MEGEEKRMKENEREKYGGEEKNPTKIEKKTKERWWVGLRVEE